MHNGNDAKESPFGKIPFINKSNSNPAHPITGINGFVNGSDRTTSGNYIHNGSFNPSDGLTFPAFNFPSLLSQQGNHHIYEDMSMENNLNNQTDAQILHHNQFGNFMNGGANMNQQYSLSNPPMLQRKRQAGGLASPDPPQRAAELRQKLIAMRKSSATPPNTSSNLPLSSKTPKQQPDAPLSQPRGPSGFFIQAQPGDTDVENLINEERSRVESQIKGDMAKDAEVKIKNEKAHNENMRISSQTSITTAAPTAKPTRETQIFTGSHTKLSGRAGDRSIGELVGTSDDGEVADSQKPRRPLPPTGPKESELSVVKRKLADEVARERRDDHALEKPDYHSPTRLHRSPSMSSSRPTIPRYREDRGDVARNPYHQDGGCTERVEQKRYEHREDRDPVSTRASEPINETKNDGMKSRSPPPKLLLERVLEENDDLRVWLEISGWYNAEERAAKIERYRHFLALKDEFDRNQASAAAATSTGNTEGAMLPPPAPSKVIDEKSDAMALQDRNPRRSQPSNSAPAETAVRKRGREDENEHGRDDKYVRIDSGGRGVRINGENSDEYRHTDAYRRSHGEAPNTHIYEDAKSDMRRRSLSPRHFPDSRESGREFSDRGHGYNYSDIDNSGQRAFEDRPPARTFERDRELAKVDNDDWKSRRMHEAPERARVGEYTGRGYRGKQWDPNYHENRGRGNYAYRARGRGRGFGTDNASSRSYSNGSEFRSKGYKVSWNKGEKGGQ